MCSNPGIKRLNIFPIPPIFWGKYFCYISFLTCEINDKWFSGKRLGWSWLHSDDHPLLRPFQPDQVLWVQNKVLQMRRGSSIFMVIIFVLTSDHPLKRIISLSSKPDSWPIDSPHYNAHQHRGWNFQELPIVDCFKLWGNGSDGQVSCLTRPFPI